jgi:hypothetical protein
MSYSTKRRRKRDSFSMGRDGRDRTLRRKTGNATEGKGIGSFLEAGGTK